MAIENLAPRLVALAHQVLRRRLPLLMFVNKDFANVPSGIDKTIPIDVPGDASPAGNASAAAYFDPGTKSTNTKNLVLSNWIEDGWYLKDDDIAAISQRSGWVPNQMMLSLESLALRIANDGWAVYKGIYGAVGTAGTTPYGSNTDVMVDAGTKLDDQLCPPFSRVGLYNSKAKGNLLKLDAFKSFDKRGSVEALRDAELGRYLGFDNYLDQAVPLHTAGTISDGDSRNALINGAVSAGAKTMNLDSTTLTGTLVKGDIFTVAGDSQQYVVTNETPVTASGNAMTGVTFEPASVSGFADNAEVTVLGSHRVNLAYHPNAIYFGSRRMDMSDHVKKLLGISGDQGNLLNEFAMEDPLTGLVLRVAIVPGGAVFSIRLMLW